MIKQISRRFQSDNTVEVLSVLLLFAAVIIFTGIGLRSPWPADEPRFAEIAKEMVVSGHWFFPTRGGELYPDKPPVFMWSIAAFYWLTGNMKLAFLLPSALASLITLICIYDLAARLWNVQVARNSFLLALLVPQFVLQAKTAQIDAMVACWITIAMYGLIRHYFIRKNLYWYCASWGFMGIGIITKGVGFLPVLFFVPIIFFHFKDKKPFHLRALAELCLGPLCLFAVIACWLIPMLHEVDLSHSPDFIAYRNNILFKQTEERYAHSWGHIKPWYYFLVSVIPLLWFPLPLILFSRNFRQHIASNRLIQCLLIWIGLVILFFSLSPGKRGVYILPALPMFMLSLSPWLTRFTPERWITFIIRSLLWLVNIAFFVVAVLLLLNNHALLKNIGHADAGPFVSLFVITGLLWGLLLLLLRKRSIFCQLGSVMATTWMIYSTWGYILLEPIRTPAKEIMHQVSLQIGPQGTLGLVNFKEQFLLFSPIPITHFSYLAPVQMQYQNAWLWMKEAPHRYILMPQRPDIICFDSQKARIMGEGHRQIWALYDANTLKTNCPAPREIKRYHMPFKPIENQGRKS